MNEGLLLTDEQRKWALEMETTPGEEAVKVLEMTRKDLTYYIKLVDKAAVHFERTDSKFKRSTTERKMLSNSTACHQREL